MDTLASAISVESDDGYIPVNEYQAYVKKAVGELEIVIEKLDGIIAGAKA